jgi:hypothetical protein
MSNEVDQLHLTVLFEEDRKTDDMWEIVEHSEVACQNNVIPRNEEETRRVESLPHIRAEGDRNETTQAVMPESRSALRPAGSAGESCQ